MAPSPKNLPPWLSADVLMTTFSPACATAKLPLSMTPVFASSKTAAISGVTNFFLAFNIERQKIEEFFIKNPCTIGRARLSRSFLYPEKLSRKLLGDCKSLWKA
jgi:hypothetical protein